jgi:HAD superfamily hydrolase (TIGR01549 family)
MPVKSGLDWSKIKVVIFDVDGTLYTQSKLRKQMLWALLWYYARHPWRLGEMRLLQHFRAEREKRAGDCGGDLANAQYNWCAEKSKYPVAKVREVVNYWMMQFPNQYLGACTYPGTQAFFKALQENNIRIAIYSDYPAHDKLAAMGLPADLVVSSTDPEVDRLKPDPKGLLYITQQLGVQPAECLFIGDRPELDGECARQANMPYLIVEKKPFNQFDFYLNLLKQVNLSFNSNIYETSHLSS